MLNLNPDMWFNPEKINSEVWELEASLRRRAASQTQPA